MSIASLAEAVYGTTDRTSANKIRSNLQTLKKRGEVHMIAPGVWEATPKK